MKDEINKYLEIECPLIAANADSDKIDIFAENKKFIIAILYRNQFNTIEFNFFHEFDLITPSLDIYNNGYLIDYSKVPFSMKSVEDFKYIIVRIDSVFFCFNLKYDNDYQIIKDEKDNKKLCIKFSSGQFFKVHIYKYDNLNDFYISINNNFKLLPTWINNPGLIIEANELANNDIKFTDLKSELKNNEVFIILKNWISYNDKNKIKKDLDLNHFLERLKFSDIRYILQYGNTVPKGINPSSSFLKMSNGQLFEENNLVFIDYFNKDGEEELINFFKEILAADSKGIYLNPTYFFFKDEETLDKVITKNKHEIILYSKNVKKGLIKINKCIKKIKAIDEKSNFIFASNVLSDSIKHANYIREVTTSLEREIIIFEDLYKQGFTNFGLYINLKNTSFNKKDLIRIFILIFITPIYLFDLNLIEDMKKNPALKENLIDILKVRGSINSLYDNIFIDFKENGSLPIKSIVINDKIRGFFIGEYFYLGLLNEGLFGNSLYLPEGKWYSLSDNFIINGGSNFIYKGINKVFCLLQKENTITINNYTSERNQFLKNKKIRFIVYLKDDNLSKEKTSRKILERLIFDKREIDVNHYFEIKTSNNKIIIDYNSKNNENIGRYIYFIFVTGKKNIERIICNSKKIIYSIKENSIEFNSLNKENKLNYEISFS